MNKIDLEKLFWNNNPMRQKNQKMFLAAVLAVVIFISGVYVGYAKRPSIDKISGVANKSPEVSTNADFEPFWKVWNLINEKSPDAKNIKDQDRVWGAISGLVSSLNDPYSEFFPPEESKNFNDQVAGSFGGIGMEVGVKDKILTVISPLKGTPAEKAGIKSGDKILKINGTTTNDMTIDQAIDLIRGEKGTKVVLTIFREGESTTRDISVVRDTIAIPTLDAQERKDGIYVISLYNFSANSSELFKEAAQKLAESGSDKLILDLRGNPGGYLDSAIDIASWFLPSDKVVVQEDNGDPAKLQVFHSKGYGLFNDSPKMVVLVDGGSASASEILAGALSQNGRAKLVGATTYGKGSVQELIPVTTNPATSVKITIAKWLTPNGTSISKKGIDPDYKVEIKQSDIDNHRDPQLDKAVELLLAK
jgi:carboxyl-terminal processing protease